MTQVCPYCREGIANSEILRCPGCGTPHHYDCWEENGGCTVFGCERAPVEEPKISITPSEIGASSPGRRPPVFMRAPSLPIQEAVTDPFPDRMRFGRLFYAFSWIASTCILAIAMLEPETESAGRLVFFILMAAFLVLRLRDIGDSPWWALLLIVPILNIFVFVRALIVPHGYAVTRKADTPMIVTGVLFGILLLMMILLLIISAISV